MSPSNQSAAVVFLHNPSCSKSRATKAVLDQAGVAHQERLYLQDPLSIEELTVVAEQLGKHPREWVRSGQAEYADAGLDGNSTPAELFAAMAKTPILMERPIVIAGGRAAIGRPPIAVLELF